MERRGRAGSHNMGHIPYWDGLRLLSSPSTGIANTGGVALTPANPRFVSCRLGSTSLPSEGEKVCVLLEGQEIDLAENCPGIARTEYASVCPGVSCTKRTHSSDPLFSGKAPASGKIVE
jgi:hypothetical protein